ncbi:hypothetical protein DXT98_01320 [Agrobacterium sp. ICMP 7243]|nr:hypothetical protein DXT98_01320 [Agrobacterium sp. ICMP 7243]
MEIRADAQQGIHLKSTLARKLLCLCDLPALKERVETQRDIMHIYAWTAFAASFIISLIVMSFTSKADRRHSAEAGAYKRAAGDPGEYNRYDPEPYLKTFLRWQKANRILWTISVFTLLAALYLTPSVVALVLRSWNSLTAPGEPF